MPTYLFQGHYNAAMVEALHANGAACRVAAITAGAAAAGGAVEAMYWVAGGVDSFVIAELPDDTAAQACTR